MLVCKHSIATTTVTTIIGVIVYSVVHTCSSDILNTNVAIVVIIALVLLINFIVSCILLALPVSLQSPRARHLH